MIKAHEGERAMARELTGGRARALYAYRDVRDVVFSLMHKRGKTFEQILRQGMIHQILANDRFWMAQPNVLVQRYEDLIAEPAAGSDRAGAPSRARARARRGRADRGDLFAGIEPGAHRGAQAAARAGGRGSRKRRQHPDLRPVVALALEPHEAEGGSLVAHDGDAATDCHPAPALRPLARVARLFTRRESERQMGFLCQSGLRDAVAR